MSQLLLGELLLIQNTNLLPLTHFELNVHLYTVEPSQSILFIVNTIKGCNTVYKLFFDLNQCRLYKGIAMSCRTIECEKYDIHSCSVDLFCIVQWCHIPYDYDYYYNYPRAVF